MITKLKDGSVLKTHNDLIGRAVRQTKNYYEHRLLTFIKSKASFSKGVIVDVGANIGNHTMFFANNFDLKVISFEPYPSNFQLLTENVSLNSKNSQVTCIDLALSNEEYYYSFENVHQTNMGMVDIKSKIETNGLKTSKLSKLIEDEIAILKIDCEGQSSNVLKDAISNAKFVDDAIISVEGSKIEIDAIMPSNWNYLATLCNTPTQIYIKKQ